MTTEPAAEQPEAKSGLAATSLSSMAMPIMPPMNAAACSIPSARRSISSGVL